MVRLTAWLCLVASVVVGVSGKCSCDREVAGLRTLEAEHRPYFPSSLRRQPATAVAAAPRASLRVSPRPQVAGPRVFRNVVGPISQGGSCAENNPFRELRNCFTQLGPQSEHMKTVRITFSRSRGWLGAVIGVLGIIGGARQQVWASSSRLPQSIERTAASGSAGVLPACFSNQESAIR